ncbi:hypothetical protein PMAYCL1PPCAC_23093, partial [Pristionchus mayeri]
DTISVDRFMASPDWPNWEFKDGRKRMTLPIVDARGDSSTPRPSRLNSTESARKKTKSDGENVPSSISASSHQRRVYSKDGGGGWLSKESTQREIRLRRSMENQSETILDTVPEKKSTVAGRSSIDMKKRSETSKDAIEQTKKEDKKAKENLSTLLETVPDEKSTVGRRSSIDMKRSEILSSGLKHVKSFDNSATETAFILPDTVPEKKSTVGRRPSIDMKRKSETPFRSLENVKNGEKSEKKKLLNLPEPLSELMLERDASGRKEREVKKRREDLNERSLVPAPRANAEFNIVDGVGESTTPRPPRPRKQSFFFPSKNRTGSLQRRASLDSTVPPERSTVNRRDEIDRVERSSVARTTSVSPFGATREEWIKPVRLKERKGREEEGKAKAMRRSTDGDVTGNWITPSLQDFR